MFNSNFLVKNGHKLTCHLAKNRLYCQKPIRSRLQEKFYIVELKNDSSKTLPASKDSKAVIQSSISEIPVRVSEKEWMRVYDALNDIIRIYKNQIRIKMEKVGIDDHFINEKKEKGVEILKIASEKTPLKLKEFSNASQEQWEVMKKSENMAKIKKLPTLTVNFTKDVYIKAHHYWIIFENSPYKEKLVGAVNMSIKYGRKGAAELYKFYKHVINAPVKKL